MPAQSHGRASRLNPANSESSLLQQSGTEGYPATRGTFGHTVRQHSSNASKTQTRNNTVSKSTSLHRRYDDADHHRHHSQTGHSNDNNARFAHTETLNIHSSSSSSRIRLSGKDNNESTPRSEMVGRNSQRMTRSELTIGSGPQPSRPTPSQSNTLSGDALQLTTKSGDKRKEMSRRNMDNVAGFDSGPSTVPARPTQRRIQKTTGAVPIPVPGKGTRPSPVQSTSIEAGKNKEIGQANQLSQSSSLAIIERGGIDNFNGRPALLWDNKPKKKPARRKAAKNTETTNIIDVDKCALDAERQKKAAMLKKFTFSKKKVIEVKEEVREEEDALRAGMGDEIGDHWRRSKESGGGGESREATTGEVNAQVGEEILQQVPPQRGHSPWTCDGQGNIPGLSTTSRSARTYGPYTLSQAAGVETLIPLPSLYPDPSDILSDISDDDLYSPKGVEKVSVDVQVKEEQREDENVFFDSLISDPFPDLQTPISAPSSEQNAAGELSIPAHADNSASYPLDTECTIHPKNKRKQHGLSYPKNAPSPKKVKADNRALNVEEGQSQSNREAVRVQDEDGGEVPRANIPDLKKRGPGRRQKKKKGKKKKDAAINQVETPVVTTVQEVPLTGVEEQGEMPTGDALSSTAGPSDPQTGIGGRKESDSTRKNVESAEQGEHVNAAEIPVAPSTDPLPESASVHHATRVEPSAPVSVRRSPRKGKNKDRAIENGASSTDKVSKRKRKVRGQATEAGEQTQNHDTNRAGDEEISRQDETPRKKRKVQTQATESERSEANAVPVSDGEEPCPGKTSKKRTKVNDRTTEGRERTQGGVAGDEHIPQQEETMNDPTTEGGERIQVGLAGDEHLAQEEETPKMNDQTTEGGEMTEGIPAMDEHIPQEEGTPKKDKTTEGGENIQGSSTSSTAADDITRTPKKKGKAKDQSATEDAPEAEKKVKKRGRPRKEKKNDEDTTRETSSVKVTEEDGSKGKTPRGRKKRETMDEKDGTADGVVRKKKRIKLAFEEGGDGDRQSGKQSTVKWMLVCKNRTATGRKSTRLGKGKEKVQSTPTAPDLDADEEETDDNIKTRKTLRPSIWASSKTELLLVLPELSSSKCFNGITEGSSNFPMVMLDESTAEAIGIDVRWFDGERSDSSGETPSVRLTLTRDFVCPVPDLASTGEILMDSVASSDARPSSCVMTQPNVPSSAAPGASSVRNVYGNGCGSLPVVMPYDDNDRMDLEYIDEDVPQRSPVSFIPTVPTAQDATTVAHISHKAQSLLQAPAFPTCHPPIQFNPYNPTTLSTPSTISIPSREATNTAHISHKVQSYSHAPALQTCYPSFQFNPYNPTNLSTPSMISIPPQEATDTAHISHKVQSFSQAPTCHPSFQFSPYNPTNFSTPSMVSIPPRDATTTAHISHKVPNFSQAHAPPTCHSIIQSSQHNPTILSTPSTVSTSPLQIQHLLPFHPDQIPFPQYGNTAPVPIPIPSKIPFDDEKPSPSPPPKLRSELETIIPPSPPPEIEILKSSKRLSLPFILISSRETFKQHFWGPLTPSPHSNSPEQAKFGLAAEHAYVFLGFFRVIKTGERRVTLSDEERVDLAPGKMAGRVEWTFDIEWVPGYHGSKGSEELNRPWWAPDFVFGRPVGRERGSKKGFNWLEKHGQARLNLLPMQLVDGQEAGSSDEAMPKGWLCKACGKLNQKVMMRHRWCGSRMCRDNPLSRGYAVDLSSARDANQTPLALPINTCNRRTMDASVADWDDGMRTLKYRPMAIPDRLGNPGQRSGILQHVFTCNLVDLQTEATSLFESIQSDVCLMKSTGDSGPFFKSYVSDWYANQRDKYAFSCMSWSEAPQAVRDAQELMTFMGKKYGEEETLDIDKLTIIGWVSSGTRKTPTILEAREHAIAMLCLGNDVVLTIVPKWESSAPILGSYQVQQSLNLSCPPYVPPSAPGADMTNSSANLPSIPVLPYVANFTPPNLRSTLARTPKPIMIKPPRTNEMQLVDASATENHVQQVSSISENPPSGVVPAQITSRNSRSKPASKLKPKPNKQASESMSVTLVHGDMLLFSGCDFEYSIKRMGTSILVIGSKEDSTASI